MPPGTLVIINLVSCLSCSAPLSARILRYIKVICLYSGKPSRKSAVAYYEQDHVKNIQLQFSQNLNIFTEVNAIWVLICWVAVTLVQGKMSRQMSVVSVVSINFHYDGYAFMFLQIQEQILRLHVVRLTHNHLYVCMCYLHIHYTARPEHTHYFS